MKNLSKCNFYFFYKVNYLMAYFFTCQYHACIFELGLVTKKRIAKNLFIFCFLLHLNYYSNNKIFAR